MNARERAEDKTFENEVSLSSKKLDFSPARKP
jgi:hypothetical protein